jgi:large subunit ribosomal protein L35
MPKMKPHKGLKKRVKVTARGKVLRKKSFHGHLLSGKSGRRKQRLRKSTVMVSAIAENVKIALCQEGR